MYQSLLREQLELLKSSNQYRTFTALSYICGQYPFAKLNGEQPDPVVVWCSNDYLGVSQHPTVREQMHLALETYGAGSGGSRNIGGSYELYERLEASLADWHDKEAALVFPTGFGSNDATVQCLLRQIPDCVVISDALNHASIVNGIRATPNERQVFRHNDVEHLAQILSRYPIGQPKVVVFESIYSMDGDIAPIADIVEVAKRFPAAIQAQTFPWLVSVTGKYFDGKTLFDPALLHQLDLPGFVEDSYSQALSEAPVLPSEEQTDRRMRQMSYVNLTRFVQTLLDRKDRMSMAVGLEVRVPFCDHRLVEYAFNIPWEMKTFDGREKSILRAATRDLLPKSISDRVKSPYPSTQDPAYEQALRTSLTQIMADKDAPVRALLDASQVKPTLKRPVGDTSPMYDRMGMELAVGLNTWLTEQDVSLDL
ncbi:aminotransferase class I/II-fold pyridoxal phosphate-dependent enzyme [Stutzerimonas stutzeri]|uniref:aminotransferase class I/II-fold pyridoxal phosphate-dependent enzyme n=1 Tax=Stutzerimonas stutzeri TaxID=316 RepID=UPI00069B2696|nr:aminotransferase class I/II-fold pyridoxal phosphate-dependent enzyme [Stutzerimonas stutzeri]